MSLFDLNGIIREMTAEEEENYMGEIRENTESKDDTGTITTT